MATAYGAKDEIPWKAVNFQGKTLRNGKGELMDHFHGFKDANVFAKENGGTAVRS